VGEFFRRLRYLLNSRRFDEELQNDLEFHREMAARQGRQNLGDMPPSSRTSPRSLCNLLIPRN
jgi:hypothetical protein